MLNDDQNAWLRSLALVDEGLAGTMRDFLLGVKPGPTGVDIHRAREIAGPVPVGTVNRRAH